MLHLLATDAGHAFIYFGLSLAYLDAAFESFAERNQHSGWREVCMSGLYGLIAFMVLMAFAH
jgi:hypothetical protein